VPDVDEPDCRIRVVCYDAESNEGSDASDGDFRIIPHDGEAPVVTVLDPNGGEEIDALTEYTISWTSSDNVGVTATHVLLSTDGGASYPDTVASLTDETSYLWTVPDVDEPDCRIRVVCYDAASNHASDESDADFSIVGVPSGVEDHVEIPTHLILRQSWPNPFNPMTTIEFGLPEEQRVRLSVYSANGKLIETLADGVYAAGYHTIVWRGTNAHRAEVARGLYLYRLVTDREVLTQKMLLLK
jgi:hypothetical protein